MNPRLKSRTNRFAIGLAVFGVVEANMPMLHDYLGEWYGLAFVAVAVAVGVLREVTTKPVTEL